MQLLLQSEQDRVAAEAAQKTNEAQIRALMTGNQGSLVGGVGKFDFFFPLFF